MEFAMEAYSLVTALMLIQWACIAIATVILLQHYWRRRAAIREARKDAKVQEQVVANDKKVISFPELGPTTPASAEVLVSVLQKEYQLVAFEPNKFVHVVNPEQLKYIAATLAQEKVLGLDIENDSLHSYNGSICLLQIATSSTIFIIDAVALDASLIARYLGPVLKNPEIVKIFHDCRADLMWLQRDYELVCVNIFDTCHMARKLGTFVSLGLEKLWKHYCNYVMLTETKKQFQLSDWTVRPLPKEQLNYAAVDSHYLRHIRSCLIHDWIQVHGLEALLRELSEMQKLGQERHSRKRADDWISAFRFRALALTQTSYISEAIFEWLWLERDSEAQKLNFNPESVCSTDVLMQLALKLPENAAELERVVANSETPQPPLAMPAFVQARKEVILSTIAARVAEWKAAPEEMKKKSKALQMQSRGTRSPDKAKSKAERREKTKKQFTTKKPVYENCRLMAADGELLCNCDRKKVEWYVKKGLAKLVSEDPLIGQLLFEANGRRGRTSKDISDDLFYTAHRENKCVLCGATSDLVRYYIVPLVYRQQFPEEFKSHRSHDVVLLCFDCNERSTKTTDDLKRELAVRYNAPLVDSDKRTQVRRLEKVKTIARKLQKISMVPAQRSKMEERMMLLLREANQTGYPCPELAAVTAITEETLKKVEALELPDEHKNGHGELVVKQAGDLEDFIKMWRKFFLERMQPQFMPPGWSIDHRVDRSFGTKSSFNPKRNIES